MTAPPQADDLNGDRPDAWIERAVTQARALRETVRDRPDLRDLVDAILLDLMAELARRPHTSGD